MKSKWLTAFLIGFTFIFSTAYAQDFDSEQSEKWRHCSRGARAPAAITNYENIAFTTSSGKSPTMEQVKQAIIRGAGNKKWTVSTQQNGILLATLNVRGKHTMAVEITYSQDKYSLRYKDSTNMNYAMCGNQAVIHPNYNKWVSNMRNGIQAQLQAL